MILAVDVGTSSMKGGLVSSRGRLQAWHKVYFPRRGRSGPFSPLLWIRGLEEIGEVLGCASVEAVAISGNGPTMTAVDSRGQPLGAAMMWDFSHTGGRPPGDGYAGAYSGSSYYLKHIAWLREYQPDLYRQADCFLSCSEFLCRQLTGQNVMVYPHKGYYPYVWTEGELKKEGFSPEQFPELVPMGSVAGKVLKESVLKSSLPEGIPVVACGSDFMASLIGTGSLVPGRLCDRAGTSEGLNYCSEKPCHDSRLRLLPHAVESMSNVSVILSSTGSLFEWYRRLTGQENMDYRDTMAGIAATPAEQDHPFFFPSLRGADLWEFSGGMAVGLDPSQGRFELGRAVLEAIGFALRRGLEVLEERGLPVKELRISGGQGKSPLWNQMKADMTGRLVAVPEIEDAELGGCACLAAAALGYYPSFLEAAHAMVRIKAVYAPRKDLADLYSRKYDHYCRAGEEALRFHRAYPPFL